MILKQGDCLDIMKDVDDKSVDVAFTSPPYNRKRNDKYKFYDDGIKDYFKFLCEFTEDLMRITKRYVIVNIQKTYYNKSDVFKYIGKYADKIAEIIVWEKSNPMPASGNAITNAYEFFIIFSDVPVTSNDTYTKNHITTCVNSNMPKEHKAVMVQEVSDWFIQNFTKRGDVVIDPFMGTGTTGISCVKYGRQFFGIELNESYYKMATQRLSEEIYTYDDLWKNKEMP